MLFAAKNTKISMVQLFSNRFSKILVYIVHSLIQKHWKKVLKKQKCVESEKKINNEITPDSSNFVKDPFLTLLHLIHTSQRYMKITFVSNVLYIEQIQKNISKIHLKNR